MTEAERLPASLLDLIYEVANSAIGAPTVLDAVQTALDGIRSFHRWRIGHAYRLGTSGRFWIPLPTWSLDPEIEAAAAPFVEATMSRRIGAREALWAERARRGEPHWVEDLRSEERWQRPCVHSLGLRFAAFFPVPVQDEPIAVLEFFCDVPTPREPLFVQTVRNITLLLGQTLERNQLKRQIVDLTEGDARRLAAELHDNLGQQIAGAGMLAESLAGALRRRGAPELDNAEHLVGALSTAREQLRNVAHGLRPVDVVPGELEGALRTLARGVSTLYGIACDLEVEHGVRVEDSRAATHLFRIAQEAIHNAAVHGRATRVALQLGWQGDHAQLSVRDNGGGMPQEASRGTGMGLRIMHYRAGLIGGWLAVETSSRGTTVRCTLPADRVAVPPGGALTP